MSAAPAVSLARATDNGAEPSGACRELYLETPMDDRDSWVTELQQPFNRRS